MRYLFILVTILVVGCSSIGDVVKEGAYVEKKISSGEVKETLTAVDLSTQEEQILTHSLNQVVKFRQNYGSFISDPSKLLTFSQDELNRDYDELRDSFMMVQKIIIKNWPLYSPEEHEKLIEYQKHAYYLDQAVQELIQETEYRSAIREALTFGFAALQVIASLK